jgi:hypothetical protein
MKLEELAQYAVDIGDTRTTYYRAAQVIYHLGFVNVSQTIESYCKFPQPVVCDVLQDNGVSRRMKLQVIPESDVLTLVEYFNNKRDAPINMSAGKTRKSVNELETEIAKLQKVILHRSVHDIPEIESQHRQEIEDLEMDHIQEKQDIEDEIQTQINQKQTQAREKSLQQAEKILADAQIRANALIAIAKQRVENLLADSNANLPTKSFERLREHCELSHKHKLNMLTQRHSKEIRLLNIQAETDMQKLKERKRKLLMKSGYKSRKEEQ